MVKLVVDEAGDGVHHGDVVNVGNVDGYGQVANNFDEYLR